MRVGVLTTSYPRHTHDPSGCFVAEMSEWFADAGDQVEVLAPHPARSEHPGVTLRPLRYAISPRLLFGAGAPDNLRRHPRAWLQIPAFTGRLAMASWRCSAGWDGVISHWILPCGVVAARASRVRPHLAVAHSSDVHLLRKLPYAASLLEALARPRTRLVLTSEALRVHLARLARGGRAQQLIDHACVVRMGISLPAATLDRSAASRLRRRHGLGERPVALFIGRLVPVKGLDLLIRACADLLDVELVILGDGPELPRLKRLAVDLEARVRFLGQVTGADKAAWLAAADLFAAPSVILPDGSTDSAPVALLEAMSAGLPVVASAVGGNAELISSGEDGLLIPPGDLVALRRAISRLARHADLGQRLGAAARVTSSALSWDNIGRQLRGLLAAL